MAGNFSSIHQYSVRVVKDDNTEEFNTGFKNQYKPTGVTGCSIGFDEPGCLFPGIKGSENGSLTFSESIMPGSLKIFLPLGTNSVTLVAHDPQNSKVGFAIKYGTEPERTSSLTDAEYATAGSINGGSGFLNKIMESEEDTIIVHDGGGTIRLIAGTAIKDKLPGWLYVRLIHGTPPHDISGGMNINLNDYSSWYDNAEFGTDGDPPDPYIAKDATSNKDPFGYPATEFKAGEIIDTIETVGVDDFTGSNTVTDNVVESGQKSGYTPITANFKETNSISNLTIEAGEVWFYDKIVPSSESGAIQRIRIFIPPGTKSFKCSLYLNTTHTPGDEPYNFVVLKFGTPSKSSISSVESSSGDDSTKTLESLMTSSDDLIFSSPLNSGGVPLSSVGAEYTTTKGGWVYIDVLRTPGNTFQKLDCYIHVDETTYKKWYAKALFDTEGNPLEFVGHTQNGTSSTTSTSTNTDSSAVTTALRDYPALITVDNGKFENKDYKSKTVDELKSIKITTDKGSSLKKFRVFIPPKTETSETTFALTIKFEKQSGDNYITLRGLAPPTDKTTSAPLDDAKLVVELNDVLASKEINFKSKATADTLTIYITSKVSYKGHWIYFHISEYIGFDAQIPYDSLVDDWQPSAKLDSDNNPIAFKDGKPALHSIDVSGGDITLTELAFRNQFKLLSNSSTVYGNYFDFFKAVAVTDTDFYKIILDLDLTKDYTTGYKKIFIAPGTSYFSFKIDNQPGDSNVGFLASAKDILFTKEDTSQSKEKQNHLVFVDSTNAIVTNEKIDDLFDIDKFVNVNYTGTTPDKVNVVFADIGKKLNKTKSDTLNNGFWFYFYLNVDKTAGKTGKCTLYIEVLKSVYDEWKASDSVKTDGDGNPLTPYDIGWNPPSDNDTTGTGTGSDANSVIETIGAGDVYPTMVRPPTWYQTQKPTFKPTVGFRDPNVFYPRSFDLEQVFTNRLARGVENAEDLKRTILPRKDAARVVNVRTASPDGKLSTAPTWSQTPVPYNAEYPYNHVRQSESGHIEEWDDTPGNERLHRWHRVGTYEEIDRNGTKTNRIVGDSYMILERHGNILIRGNCNVTIQGTANMLVEQNVNMEILGNYNVTVGGDMTTRVKGRYNLDIGDNSRIRSKKEILFMSKTIKTQTDGETVIGAKGNLYLNGKRIDLNLDAKKVKKVELDQPDNFAAKPQPPVFAALFAPVRTRAPVKLDQKAEEGNTANFTNYIKKPYDATGGEADKNGVKKNFPGTPDTTGLAEAVPDMNQPTPVLTGKKTAISFVTKCLNEAKLGQWSETGMGGKASNGRILGIWKSLGFPQSGIWTSDQTAWCAGFVNYALQQSGLPYVQDAGARNTISKLLSKGHAEEVKGDWEPGDIVLWKFSHVNFVFKVDMKSKKASFVGGNQSDKARNANNPSGGTVSESWAGPACQRSNGQIDKVIRIKNKIIDNSKDLNAEIKTSGTGSSSGPGSSSSGSSSNNSSASDANK